LKTFKRGQRYNQSGVSHETSFSNDNWESKYFKMVWMSWNWPSQSRECLLHYIHWHLVIESSSSTVKKPTSASQYYRFWMWRQFGTRHYSCLSETSNYENWAATDSKIQNWVITDHSSQQRMNGPLSSI
jgi:hypothetical protein